jgi:hypothetical protein
MGWLILRRKSLSVKHMLVTSTVWTSSLDSQQSIDRCWEWD